MTDTAEAGIFTEPPVLTLKTDRTHCEYCQEPLDPNVYHKCAGNEEYKPRNQSIAIPEEQTDLDKTPTTEFCEHHVIKDNCGLCSPGHRHVHAATGEP